MLRNLGMPSAQNSHCSPAGFSDRHQSQSLQGALIKSNSLSTGNI